MSQLPNNPSEAVKRLNPHIYQLEIQQDDEGRPVLMSIGVGKPRLRQSSKPVMNKLEQEWFNLISARQPNYPRPKAQAVRFKLANGVTYTPDVFVTCWPVAMGPASATAWEVKGKHSWDDAIVKLKVAAHEWPDIQWVLVWKDDSGQWQEQTILP